MINRFRTYLDKTFKYLPYTEEALELREEILSGLMERAEELKSEGLSEDEIFDKCVSSLGDYTETIKALKRKPFSLLKDTKFQKGVLSIIAFVLCSVIVYVLLGTTLNLWGLGAIIIFPSMAGLIYIGISASMLLRNVKSKRHLTSGIIIASYFVIYVLVFFFILTFALNISASKTWVMFTYIPALILCAHMIAHGYLRQKKIWLAVWLLLTVLVAVPVYLTSAVITGLWHPLWVIVLGGVVLDFVILILRIGKAS